MNFEYINLRYHECFQSNYRRVGQASQPYEFPQIMSAICLDSHTAPTISQGERGIFSQPTLLKFN